MNNKVIVLGAGIAGLAVSINLLQKGYDVTLIEKNKEVGGLCSGYFVDGYYIDACLHWLMGTNKKSQLYKEWKNIGALTKDTKIISLPTLGSFEYEGTTVTFYRNLNKTEKELIKISPEDKKAIRKFAHSVKDMGSIMGLVLKNKNLNRKEIIHLLPNSGHIIRSIRWSREEYAARFKHPAIQFAIKNAQTGYNNIFFYLDLYGLFTTGNADVPEGGAYYMVQRIKQRFLDLGGKLILNTEAIKLNVKDEKVVSLKTNNEVIKADYFISTIDPKYTLKELLGNKFRIKLFDKLESTISKRSISSCFNVYIAVDGDISKIDVPTVLHTKPIKVGSREVDALLVRHYGFDPDHFTKDGKTVVSLFVDQNQDDFNYFKSLSSEGYKKEKERITNDLIKAFNERYPNSVKFLSAFGPLELCKQTNTGYGSIQSYSFTDKGMIYSFNGKMKDIKNLFFCGQWTRSIGGTPTALLTAVALSKQFKNLK